MKRVTKQSLILLLCLTGGLSSAACSSDSDSDSDSDTDDDETSSSVPSDNSEEAITLYLENETYKEEPWIGDAAPRLSPDAGNIHSDSVKVYFNPNAARSKETEAKPALLDAMLVKEFYDDAGALLGKAVMWKTDEAPGRDSWTYYCTAPDGSDICTGASEDATTTPIYGQGLAECGFCHGEVPYAPLPN